MLSGKSGMTIWKLNGGQESFSKGLREIQEKSVQVPMERPFSNFLERGFEDDEKNSSKFSSDEVYDEELNTFDKT